MDSAQLLKYVDNRNLIIGDFGSGAGFPGIILSILGIKEVHLIEKSFRKSQFLELSNKVSPNKIIIHHKRIEEIKNIKFDIITSRALAPLNKLIKLTKPFLKKDTKCLFLKGRNLGTELDVSNLKANYYKIYPSLTAEDSNLIIIDNFCNI